MTTAQAARYRERLDADIAELDQSIRVLSNRIIALQLERSEAYNRRTRMREHLRALDAIEASRPPPPDLPVGRPLRKSLP